MKNKELLLSTKEHKELALFKHLFLHNQWHSLKELTQVIGYGGRSLQMSRQRLQKKIEEYGLENELKIQIKDKPISLRLMYRKKVTAELFLLRFYLHSGSYRLLSEIYQNPGIHFLGLIKRLGVSETYARQTLQVIEKVLAHEHIHFEQRGYQLVGKEEVIREMLFQFWKDFSEKSIWVLDIVTYDSAKTRAEILLKQFGIKAISEKAFDRICLRIGIQSMRTTQGFHVLNNYLEDCFDFSKTEKLLTMQKTMRGYLPMSEYRHFLHILCCEKEVENVLEKTIIYPFIQSGVKTFLFDLEQIFPNLHETALSEIKSNLHVLFFKLLTIGKTAISHENINHYQSTYPENFQKVCELSQRMIDIFSIEHLRPIVLGTALFEVLLPSLEMIPRTKVFLDTENLAERHFIKDKISESFSEIYDFHFVDDKSYPDINMIITTNENYRVKEENVPVVKINEIVTYYDCRKIESTLEYLEQRKLGC